jgi:hypothetical protein
MRVYIELNSGKYIESSLYEKYLEESLLQLLAGVRSFHQQDVSDIVAIHYSPLRYDFKPYSICGFRGQIDGALLAKVRARFLEVIAARSAN